MSKRIEVPNNILMPARAAVIGLDRIAHGQEPSDTLPPVGVEALVYAFNTGIKLARQYGETGSGAHYFTDMVDVAGGSFQLIGRGGPAGGPASLEIQSLPPISGEEREFTVVTMTGVMGRDRNAVINPGSLVLNGRNVEPSFQASMPRLVTPIVTFAETVLPQLH